MKRFGARYGRTVKHKRAKVERIQKGKHECPYCSSDKVSRIAVGIWKCSRCNSKFTARAYSVGKPVSYVESKEDMSAEFPEEKVKKVQVEEAEA